MKLAKRVLYGMIAGAAGTAALNATTYGDMLLRGRPPSDVPEKMVSALARAAHVDALADPSNDAQRNRRSGAAALLGYADGIGTGALLGAFRTSRDVPAVWVGIALAAATMLWSEGLATAMRQTDPRSWGASGWVADIVPRCLYGWTACAAYDRLTRKR